MMKTRIGKICVFLLAFSMSLGLLSAGKPVGLPLAEVYANTPSADFDYAGWVAMLQIPGRTYTESNNLPFTQNPFGGNIIIIEGVAYRDGFMVGRGFTMILNQRLNGGRTNPAACLTG